jgi:molecular chaperone GrpE
MAENNKEEIAKEPVAEQVDSSENQLVQISKKEYDDIFGRLTELEAMKESLQRTAADFENAKKRLAKEREDFVKFSQEKVIKSILPVLDNLKRALEHGATYQVRGEDIEQLIKKHESLVSGVEMVYKQLQDTVKSHGLVEIEAVGKAFDPHKHEALAYVQEEGNEDEVVDVIETGYFLNDRLLRAAKVRVRQAPETPSEN